MQVTLLTRNSSITDMENFAATAALTCHANTDKDYVPAEVLQRIIKLGHDSILEHIYLTYSIKNLSRACLQELARHRHITLSVESTRHTLIKILNENIDDGGAVNEAFLEQFDVHQQEFLHEIFSLYEAIPTLTNDELKYFIPEFWPTNLIMTVNVRELRHILKLRTDLNALKEFQLLAHELFNTVPEQFKYLLQDCVHDLKGE